MSTHTHITEHLRSGASLPEACELARHSDIRMTMKYTHIGIEDQAKALSALPCQHIVSKPVSIDTQDVSADDSDRQEEGEGTESIIPVEDGAYATVCHDMSEDGNAVCQWRRRAEDLGPIQARQK